MIKVFVFLVLLFGLAINLFSQNSESSGYVILTIEDTYKTSQHGTQTYFWIAPVDSINSYNSRMARLFISGFTQNNLEDCCSGKPIDPVVYDQNSNSSLEQDYALRLMDLKELILKNKKKVQKISKNWQSGQVETVVIFATPVLGQFCSSDFHPIGQHRTGYNGKVYVPKSSFKYDGKFWTTSKANYILKQDFSVLDFDIIPN
jgi:hypothetical protein